MTEDTRKDKRAKIVSLNVRYKSATVDEFIENHSHDVSKGGLFIKTPTPFPAGTLIKFEIRIAGDKPVITGVGRVVWKREPSQASGERPSGMGVKFIKIDDSSRTLIDRVVAEREGAGDAFTSENEAGDAVLAKATSDGPSALSLKATPIPGGEAHGRPPGGEVRKQTITGLGIPSSPPPANDERSSIAGGMFPQTNSEGDMPPAKERTVMKQAAELLEEALKEAGGSMDEIGNNPLFAEGNKLEPRVSSAAEHAAIDRKATLLGMPSPAPAVPGRPTSAPKVPSAAPAEKKKVPSDSPPTRRETPSAKMPAEEAAPTSRQRKTDPPKRSKPPVVASAQLADEPMAIKKSGNGLLWTALIVVVAAGVAYVYKDNVLGTGPSENTTTAPPVLTPPPPAPTPTVTASAATPPSASAAPTTSASAAPTTSASAAPTTSVKSSASAAPTTSAPSTTASAAATASAKPAPTATPTPTATAAPTATAPKPVPRPTPTATAAPTVTAPPAPKPKPRPAPTPPPDSDNPY